MYNGTRRSNNDSMKRINMEILFGQEYFLIKTN